MTIARAAASSADGTAISYLTVGRGEPLLLIGGVLRTAHDYLPLARAFGEHFTVHVLERRGRGASGPQGAAYSADKEAQDVAAVVAATGATRVFGHSYGGLIALRAALRRSGLGRLALYEPGVSVRGSIPLGWMPAYRARLMAGDRRGAFACLATGSGHAPKAFGSMPLPLAKVVLRLAIRSEEWRGIDTLLEATLLEHEEIARLDGQLDEYSALTGEVLVLCGAESPPASTLGPTELTRAIPGARLETLPGLAHQAPEKAAAAIVAAAAPFLLGG